MIMSSRHWVAGVVVMACLGLSMAEELPDAVELAPRVLRGYGSIEGRFDGFTLSDGSVGTRLVIGCENEAKARLTAAKFARDLVALEGLGNGLAVVGGGQDARWQAPGQGWLMVGQDQDKVTILTAPTEALLDELARRFGCTPAKIDESLVPMFLDMWDRHGFRFYYRPWETPPEVDWKAYPVLEEFDFGKRLGGLGFIFWAKPDETDRGAAMTNDVWWDWAARAAARRDLPIVVNTVRAAPTWLLNRYRDQVMAKMPQYCGSFHSVAEPGHDGRRNFSWCATEARDAEYAIVQQHVKAMQSWPQVIDYMEPNCELKHGAYDVFLEYGPQADASYRAFLESRYGEVGVLSERWFGDAGRLNLWEDVRVPELASFLGWGPAAIDLTGEWRIAYEHTVAGATAADVKEGDAFDELVDEVTESSATWHDPRFDASSWGTVTAPGHDRQMFLPKMPAMLRREVDVPADWLGQGEQAWLYLWDLNYGKHLETAVRVYVNGKAAGEDLLRHAIPHWAAFEVTAVLREGVNTIGLWLPQSYLGYRVYLSHSPPRQYPALGAHRNAQWVDFSDWRRQTRLDTCREGMEMIRAVDPDRSIILAAPDGYFTGVRQLAETYGGRFHNTGHMGAFWNDFLPMLMRGADLPFSLEPGGPARDLAGFKSQMGLYFTEGIQAIHYFIHVGNLLWPEEIRTHFEQIQPLVKTIGKVHPPKAEIAMLLSNRANNLSGYPWGTDYNVNLPTGYWGWRFSDGLAQNYHVDAVTDIDFVPGGNADAYRVVIDTNTSVMDEATVRAIEGWVRRGGTFVTMIQTGRHTPEVPDSWPISRLTGYRVTAVDPHQADGGEGRTRGFRVLEDQTIFRQEDWPLEKRHYANGLSLEPVATDCQDLMLWEGGEVAAGMRPLGKGYVLHMGIKFGAGRGGGGGNYGMLLERILEWARIPKLPATAEGVSFRHYVSNNGLYDVWTLWNRHHDQTVRTRLSFRGEAPAICHDLLTQASVQVGEAIELASLESRILVSPRGALATAPLDWLKLQRGWWRGGAVAPIAPLAVPETPNDLDLTEEWAYQVLDEAAAEDAAPLADPALDDAAWPRRPLNCWAVGEELPSRHLFFRRHFTVPAEWQDGELTLWLRSYFSRTVVGTARYWLDGTLLPAGDGRYGLIQHLDLEPGSRHLLAVEVRGEGDVCGIRGHTWLSFTPSPRERLELAGEWESAKDLLFYGEPVAIPGKVGELRGVRRRFQLPDAWRGGAVYLHMVAGYAVTGAIVNGHYIRRHHHALGEVTFLNIGTLLEDGENEIEIPLGGGRNDRIDTLELRLYDTETKL